MNWESLLLPSRREATGIQFLECLSVACMHQGTAGTLNASPVGYQRLFGEADRPATDAESLMLNQATGAQGVNNAGRYGKKFRSLFDGEHFCVPEVGVICGSPAATRQA